MFFLTIFTRLSTIKDTFLTVSCNTGVCPIFLEKLPATGLLYSFL